MDLNYIFEKYFIDQFPNRQNIKVLIYRLVSDVDIVDLYRLYNLYIFIFILFYQINYTSSHVTIIYQ